MLLQRLKIGFFRVQVNLSGLLDSAYDDPFQTFNFIRVLTSRALAPVTEWFIHITFNSYLAERSLVST